MTSELGQGTTAQIRLPLTLAIMAALLVEADGRAVRDPARPRRAHRAPRRPGRPLGRRPPDARAARRRAADRRRRPSARRRRPTPDAEYAVIVRGGRRRFALAVTRLSASTSWSPARCRPRSPTAPPCPARAVLSDGQIALIVDCDAVVDVPVSA